MSPKFSRLRRAANPRATRAGQLDYPPSIEHPRHFPRDCRLPGTHARTHARTSSASHLNRSLSKRRRDPNPRASPYATSRLALSAGPCSSSICSREATRFREKPQDFARNYKRKLTTRHTRPRPRARTQTTHLQTANNPVLCTILYPGIRASPILHFPICNCAYNWHFAPAVDPGRLYESRLETVIFRTLYPHHACLRADFSTLGTEL